MSEPLDEVEEIVATSYKRGYEDGLAAYAHWKDGVQYVGTTGRTLRSAQESVEATWNYTP